MKNKINKKESGFIALISVVIISFVLLLIAVSLSFTGFLSRFNILDTESKEKSSELAEACLASAQLQILKDNTFVTSTTKEIKIGNSICKYTVGNTGGIVAWDDTHTNNTFTFLYAKVDKTKQNVPITLFKECPNLSPCP